MHLIWVRKQRAPAPSEEQQRYLQLPAQLREELADCSSRDLVKLGDTEAVARDQHNIPLLGNITEARVEVRSRDLDVFTDLKHLSDAAWKDYGDIARVFALEAVQNLFFVGRPEAHMPQHSASHRQYAEHRSADEIRQVALLHALHDDCTRTPGEHAVRSDGDEVVPILGQLTQEIVRRVCPVVEDFQHSPECRQASQC